MMAHGHGTVMLQPHGVPLIPIQPHHYNIILQPPKRIPSPNSPPPHVAQNIIHLQLTIRCDKTSTTHVSAAD
jgi:hypothetical protein